METENKKCAIIKIYGRVQGVFFRENAKKVADFFGLVGWAKNEQDGSVTILAEGPKNELEKFIVWCKRGPITAKVSKVEIKWQKVSGRYEVFSTN